MIVLEIIGVLIAVVIVAAVINAYDDFRKNNVEKISFKEALDLTDLPVITFQNGDKKFNFLLDTGSNISHINKSIIDAKGISFVQLDASLPTWGMEGNVQEVSACNIKLSLRDKEFEDTFFITDLSDSFELVKQESGVTLHGILGISFFDKYKYVIDFSQYVAYSAKK